MLHTSRVVTVILHAPERSIGTHPNVEQMFRTVEFIISSLVYVAYSSKQADL